MHREYHPDQLQPLNAYALQDGEAGARRNQNTSLYVLTVVLGLLLGGDVLFAALGLDSWRTPFGISLATIAALLGGARIVYGALEALVAGRIGADIALAQACIAALVIGQPFVAAEVVFIALVGEVLEAVTFSRTQRAIHRLIDQTPRTARVRRDGAEVEILAREVAVGDIVLVRPGERVPVDGPVLAGRSAVDQAALTGESIPADKSVGDPVYTGTVNQFGLLEVQAERVGQATTLGQVLRLVAEAQRHKAPLERAADRYARYFLPVVEVAAGLTLVAGYLLGWTDVWLRTVAVLVVACPCALILATPAAVLASMAWLAQHGVLIKGSVGLERLAACDTFAFDKTGTLTHGRPELAGVVPLGEWSEADVLRFAATAEQTSRHPLADVVTRAAAAHGLRPFEAFDAVALPGAGVLVRSLTAADSADAPPRTILVGNLRLMVEHGVTIDASTEQALQTLDQRGDTPLLVAIDGQVAGVIGARDTVRAEAHDVVHDLKHLKITEIAILTGDRLNAARAVAKKTHIKTVEAELLPADKARWVKERPAAGRKVAMVGDGINDAPALAQANAGIALGRMGADLAAEAGDLVVLGDPLRVLPDLVGLSRATVAVIRQNIIIFAFGLNAVAISLAAFGILGPVAAAILHQAGSLLVLLNAMRLLAYGDWSSATPMRQIRSAAEAIRRFDDHLDPGLLIDRLLGRWRALLALGLVFALLSYATWGWTAIGPDEVGLLRRQGKYLGTLGPGLHLRLPPPFERIDRLKPENLRSLEIGFRSGIAQPGDAAVRWESTHDRGVVARRDDEALLMTGDGQLVELAASTQYRLDPSSESLRSYAFGIADADVALRPLAESAVREVVSQNALDDLLTEHRHKTELDAAALLQRLTEKYRLGLVITGIAFQDVHPPLAVVDAYRDVSRGESERQRRTNEGEAYRSRRVAEAKGLAAAAVQRSEADSQGRTTRAWGEAEGFLARFQAREAFPILTDHRLYWEALATTLVGKNKVVLDPAQAQRRQLIMTDFPLGTAPPS